MKHYINWVSDSQDVIVVPTNDKAEDAVVIMTLERYNSMNDETEYLLSSDANRERLEASMRQAEAGEVVPFELEDKIKDLIRSIIQTPFKGLGKPEPLKHKYKGYWSRRITQEHRLVYKISGKKGENQRCTII